MSRRMQWLGHLARIPDTRMPKRVLFGRLEKARLRHEEQSQGATPYPSTPYLSTSIWCRSLGLFSGWYDDVQDRKLWHDKYSSGVHEIVEQRVRMELVRRYGCPLTSSVADLSFCYQQCHRRFRRAGDMRRHRCDSRRSRRLVTQSLDDLQCPTCRRSFRSRGDKVRRKCNSSRSLRADAQ